MTNIMEQEREGPATPKTRTPSSNGGTPDTAIQHETTQKYSYTTTPAPVPAPALPPASATVDASSSAATQSKVELKHPTAELTNNSRIIPLPPPPPPPPVIAAPCPRERIKLPEVNSYLTCLLCKGYLIDATTISECLHSFCRSCIIKFLQDNSHCPVCEVIVNKTKPNLKLDKTLQDIVYKLVPELYLNEMTRRRQFYASHPAKTSHLSPEQRGDDTERIIFNARDKFSLSLEYISDDSTPGAILLPNKKDDPLATFNQNPNSKEAENMMRRFLQCPGMCRIDVLKKFVRNKYSVDTSSFHIDILYKRVPLPDHYTLIDIAYIYSWKRNAPMKFFFRITDIQDVRDRFDYFEHEASSTPRLPNKIKLDPLQLLPIKQRGETSGEKVPTKVETKMTPVKKTKTVRFSTETIEMKTVESSNPALPAIKSEIKSAANGEGDRKVPAKVVKVNHVNGKVSAEKHVKKHKTSITPKPHKLNGDHCAPKFIKTCENGQNIPKNKPSEIKPVVPKHPISNVVKMDSIPSNSSMIDNYRPKQEVPELGIINNDIEKEQFLKCIQLQARKSLDNLPTPSKTNQRKSPTIPSPPNPNLKVKQPSPKSDQVKSQKRKLSSPHRNGSLPKKPKTTPVAKNKVPKDASLSKTPKESKKPLKVVESEPNLKNLLNTCKIPSSLSITCVNGDRETQIKPVINHIEILKLPECPPADTKPATTVDPKEQAEPHKKSKSTDLEKLGTTMKLQNSDDGKPEKQPSSKEDDKSEVSITITMEKSKDEAQGPKPVGVHLNLPMMLQQNPVSIRPISSFQKIFEEAVKKRPGSELDSKKAEDKNGKKSILDIATQLHKKTKFDHHPLINAEGKVAIPRLKKPTPPSQCESITNLHSNALALNYSVSVNQKKLPEPHKTPIRQDKTKPVRDESIVTSTTKVDSPGVSTVKVSNIPGKLQELSVSVSPVPSSKMSPSPDVKVTSTQPSPSLPKPQNGTKPIPMAPKPVISIRSAPPNKISKLKATPPSGKPQTPKVTTHSRDPVANYPAMPTLPTAHHFPRSPYNMMPHPFYTPPITPQPHQTQKSSPKATKSNTPNSKSTPSPPKLDVNQLQEKYNLQNLAQLSASFNFPAAFGQTSPTLAAIQQAMILNLGMNMNMTPANLVQYEKFLQSMGGAQPTKSTPPNGQSHLLSKEN